MTDEDFPEEYEPKEWQRIMLPVIKGSLSGNNAVALNIPTGSGKTSFFLSIAYQTGWRILYLARTKDEFRRPWEDNHRWFKLPIIYLMGKKDLCARPDLWIPSPDDDDDEDASNENPCKKCVLQTKRIQINTAEMMEPSAFVASIVSMAKEGFKLDEKNGLYPQETPERDLVDKKKDVKPQGFCPYYSVRSSMPVAQVVMGTYNYALHPNIRNSVFTAEKEESEYQEDEKPIADIWDQFDLVIFDEAHNLDSTIEGFGRKLTTITIEKAFKKLLGPTATLGEKFLKDFEEKYKNMEHIVGIGRILLKLYDSLSELNIEKEDHLKRYMIPEEIRELYNQNQIPFLKLATTKDPDDKEKLVYKSLHAIYSFLTNAFLSSDGKQGIYSEAYELKKPEERGKKLRRLRIVPFNHSDYFTFLKGHRVLFMSGTLPSTATIDFMWGMPETVYVTPDGVLKMQNGKRTFYNNDGLTTRGASKLSVKEWHELFVSYAYRVREIFNRSEKSVLVAFPNGKMANFVASQLRSFHDVGDQCITAEGPHKASAVRKEMLKGKRVSVTAYNSSILEGVEFLSEDKSNLLSDVILAGIPIPPPDDYRKDLSEYIFKSVPRKGNVTKEDLLYNEPALISVKQAIGRANRGSNDFVNIWLLDDRFLGSFWKNNLFPQN